MTVGKLEQDVHRYKNGEGTNLWNSLSVFRTTAV